MTFILSSRIGRNIDRRPLALAWQIQASGRDEVLGNGMEKSTNIYIRSVTSIITLTSLAKIYSAGGTAKVLDIPEDLLPMTIREALWFVAVIEAAVVLVLLRCKSNETKLLTIAWLGGNFVLYRIAASFLTAGKPCPCLGSITEKLPLNAATIDRILIAIVLYLVLGSVWFLLSNSKQVAASNLTAERPATH